MYVRAKNCDYEPIFNRLFSNIIKYYSKVVCIATGLIYNNMTYTKTCENCFSL